MMPAPEYVLARRVLLDALAGLAAQRDAGHLGLPREVSKVVLDTCGWLAYFADEPHADKFAPYIEDEGCVLVPAIVEYEVHRWALREVGEEKADAYAAAILCCAGRDGAGADAVDGGGFSVTGTAGGRSPESLSSGLGVPWTTEWRH